MSEDGILHNVEEHRKQEAALDATTRGSDDRAMVTTLSGDNLLLLSEIAEEGEDVVTDPIALEDGQQPGAVHSIIGFLEVEEDLEQGLHADLGQLHLEFGFANGGASASVGCEPMDGVMQPDGLFEPSVNDGLTDLKVDL